MKMNSEYKTKWIAALRLTFPDLDDMTDDQKEELELCLSRIEHIRNDDKFKSLSALSIRIMNGF